MAFEILVQGFDAELAKLESLPDGLRAALTPKVNGWLIELQRKILASLEGAPLKSRSGNLAASVNVVPAEASETAVKGSVVSSAENQAALSHGPNPYPYGFVHEFGGNHPFQIRPVEKRALAFDWNGKHVITMLVNRQPLPVRPWFYPAAGELRPQIAEDVNTAIREALR